MGESVALDQAKARFRRACARQAIGFSGHSVWDDMTLSLVSGLLAGTGYPRDSIGHTGLLSLASALSEMRAGNNQTELEEYDSEDSNT